MKIGSERITKRPSFTFKLVLSLKRTIFLIVLDEPRTSKIVISPWKDGLSERKILLLFVIIAASNSPNTTGLFTENVVESMFLTQYLADVSLVAEIERNSIANKNEFSEECQSKKSIPYPHHFDLFASISPLRLHSI